MTELSFAKSFLATLDNRSIKLQPDHVADIKKLELKGPYTLPRYPSSPTMHPPSASPPQSTPITTSTTTTPSAPQPITLTLKSARSPALSLTLSLPPTTTIHELKTHVAKELKREGVEGIKILYQRKPVGDGRTVGEVVGAAAGGESGEGEKGVEFGVIVMGGGAAADTGEKGTAAGKEEGGDTLMGGTEAAAREAAGGEVPVAQGISGEAVLQSAEFWDDLKGWLMQRVRDESVAEGCWSLFKRGWDER